MSLAIETIDLTKYFHPRTPLRKALVRQLSRSPADRITAVDRVSLEVKKGELFGLLGPNGAGKTTLVKILCTLILPNSGTATVNGHDLADEEKIKTSIGLISGDERSFYWRMTGRRNLEFFAALYGASRVKTAERIRSLVELLDMEAFIDRRFDRYSSGMKQRLGIARGLLNQPPLLFLDEPTKSLDPGAAARLRETIHRLVQQQGHTIVLVTHQLREAEELCDRIAIMHQGQIRVVDDTAGLRKMVRPERRYQFEVIDLPSQALSMLERQEGVLGLVTEPLGNDRMTLNIRLLEDQEKMHLAGVIDTVVGQGAQIADVRSEELSLDEVFAKYTEDTEGKDED